MQVVLQIKLLATVSICKVQYYVYETNTIICGLAAITLNYSTCTIHIFFNCVFLPNLDSDERKINLERSLAHLFCLALHMAPHTYLLFIESESGL